MGRIPNSVKGVYLGFEVVVVRRYNTSSDTIQSEVIARDTSGTRYFNSTFSVNHSSIYPFIARLWAQRKILSLLDEIAVDGESAGIIAEIVSIALNTPSSAPTPPSFLLWMRVRLRITIPRTLIGMEEMVFTTGPPPMLIRHQKKGKGL